MEEINWESIQGNSDHVLSDGLFTLISQPFRSLADASQDGSGNYLISLEKRPFYIGEANTLSARLKQQFSPSTSTFYKSWLRQTPTAEQLTIDSFRIQAMLTAIGRKEVEEFGIVSLGATMLNRFQLGKRNAPAIADHDGLWNQVQESAAHLLAEGECEMLATQSKPWFENPVPSNAGVYIVNNAAGDLIYVGESSNMSERFNTHSRRTYFSALRRHIGTEILGLTLKNIRGKKRYFSNEEDIGVTNYLKTCQAVFYPVTFGRYELEQQLIKKYGPILNRKDNV